MAKLICLISLPIHVEENLLVFDSLDETKFSRHIIIPGVHVENHMEAKAFADEVVKNLDTKFAQLLTWASIRASRTSASEVPGSSNINQAHLGPLVTRSLDITESSFKLPSILGKKAANAPKIETELIKEKVQASIKLVNESAPANVMKQVMGNMLLFTRTGAGYCPICKREHVNDNTHFVIVHDQAVCLHCRHSETHCGKKTTLLLGHLDSTGANSLRRAMSITTDEIPKAFEKQNC